MDANETILLYQDHGASEQFHSEIKTDMDLERLPSALFESNAILLLLGMLAYNMLKSNKPLSGPEIISKKIKLDKKSQVFYTIFVREKSYLKRGMPFDPMNHMALMGQLPEKATCTVWCRTTLAESWLNERHYRRAYPHRP